MDTIDLFDKFVNHINDSIVFVDKKGTILYLNDTSCKIYGASKKEMVGKDFSDLDLFERLSFQEIKKIFLDVLNGKTRTATFEIKNKQGKKIILQSSINNIVLDGKVGFLVVSRDITENKLKESVLSFNSQIVDNVNDSIVVTNMEGIITGWNKAAENLMGYKSSEVIGKHVSIIYPKEGIKTLDEDVIKPLCEKGKHVTEVWTKKKSDEIFLVRLSLSFLRDEDGKRIGMIGISKDITDEMEFQKRLAASEEKFRTIVKNSQPIIFMIDQKGIFLLSEGQMLSTLGLEPGQVVGMSAYEIYKDYPSIIQGVKDALKGKLTKNIEMIVTPNGNSYFDVFYSPHKNLSGETIACIGMAIDITSRQKAIESLKKSEEKFKLLFESANDAIFIMDNETFIDCNKKTLELFGVRREQIIGKPPWKFSPKFQPNGRESKEYAMEKINLALNTPQKFEWVHVDSSGRSFFTEVSLNKVMQDKETYIQAIVRDIDERKKSQEKIESSLSHLKNIIESTNEYILSIDGLGNITQWNQSFVNVTGIEKREMINKNILTSNFSENIFELLEFIKDYYKYGIKKFSEIIILDRNNKKRQILCSASSIKSLSSNKEGIVIVAKDVSTRYISNDITVGNTYLSYNPNFNEIESLIQTKSELKPLYITRSNQINLEKFNSDNTIFLSKEEIKGHITASTFDALFDIIRKYKKRIIYFERIDYLEVMYGFDETLKFLYSLSDYVRKTESILIIHLIRSSYSDEKRFRLESEFFALPEKVQEKILIDSDMINMLKYIAKRNSFNITVYSKHVMDEFNLSKQTTKKWLEILESKGLIWTRKEGRRKLVFITDTGKSLVL